MFGFYLYINFDYEGFVVLGKECKIILMCMGIKI